MSSVPLLIATFGLLYVFYRVFHPWVSEGISVGFEPSREKREEMMDDIYDLGETETELSNLKLPSDNPTSQPSNSDGKSLESI